MESKKLAKPSENGKITNGNDLGNESKKEKGSEKLTWMNSVRGSSKLMDYAKLIVFTLVLLGIVLYFKEILIFIKKVFLMAFPVLSGFLVAFVLNVPVCGIENFIGKMDKKKKVKPKVRRMISITATFVIIVLIFAALAVLVIPNLITTVSGLTELVQTKLPVLLTWLQEKYNIDTTGIQSFLSTFQFSEWITRITQMLSGMTGILSSTVGVLFDSLMAVIIACYALVEKETLARQTKKVLRAFLSKKHYEAALYVGDLINNTYKSFLGGQCVEAVIVSVMITIAFSICQIPYAAMIGIMTGVLSFIPYIGCWVSCGIGAFFALLINPWKAVAEIVVFQLVQFVEGQFIYPHVVGKSVGLPPLLTMVAALLGGEMFGLFGMIFFLPIASVLYTLLKNATNLRLKQKENSLG